MKLMTWTLSRPSTGQFDEYYKLKDGEPWNSKQYELVDPEAPKSYGNRTRGFVEMLEKYPSKFRAIGMHEFAVSDNGNIFNMGFSQIQYPNGYFYNNPNMRVLNEAEDDIERPVPTSLRYFMHKYPDINWAVQFLATSNSSGDRVTPILNNERKPLFTAKDYTNSPATFEPDRDADGNIIYVYAQDEFIRQIYLITKLYKDKGFPIHDVEIDFEKTWSVEGEDQLFADMLARIKKEVCIPLGVGLRVNLFAMTGEFNPSYYGWHNYATIAKANVNGVQAVDEFQLMTYDFSWGGSAPGPSTPLWWLENVLKHVKDLSDRGLWNTEDVYIGNAGYGRRWALDEERMGVTFDFKQMVQMQNGEYIHNDGSSYPDPNNAGKTIFPFRNQDFVPFAGYNDPDSDYQINYPHVYDRFVLDPDGGASFNGMNRPRGANYVTNYSQTQHAIFKGVQDYVTKPDTLEGRYTRISAVSMNNVQGDLPKTSWDKYVARSEYIHPDTGKPTGLKDDEEGRIVYNLNASGTNKLVALINFPFYGSDRAVIKVNGRDVVVEAGDWYPVGLMQRDHFIDLGTFNFSGAITVELGNTEGVQFGGFVVVKEYNHNLTGGTVDFPTSTHPYVRRGKRKDTGEVEIVEAQFPDKFSLVGEVLRRPPRPAIIWEDIFASYIESDGAGYDVISSGYYDRDTSGGYSRGSWNAYYNDDYSHAYSDARSIDSQLVLDNAFKSSVMIETEIRADQRDAGVYGLRVLAEEGRGANNGYLLLLDHAKGEIRLEWENPSNGSKTVEYRTKMTNTLRNLRGSRLTLTAYVLDGSISFRVNDYLYINEFSPSRRVAGGAYGVYASKTRIQLYKYNISSLERYERMERIEVLVDGKVVNVYGDVPRTVPTDEYGYLIYKGYPADISEVVVNPSDQNQDTVLDPSNPIVGTVLETETYINDRNKREDWSLDYLNKALAVVDDWSVGDHEVTVRMVDAGIWFRRFYVGDANGMSIAYNSDKIGFIRTANLVADYGCKGIAMWTLGQEDPTIYTYLPDVR